MSTPPPIAFVVDGEPRESARRVLPGRTLIDPGVLLQESEDQPCRGLVVAIEIDCDDAAREALLIALRGIPVVVRITLPAQAHLDLLDELSRVADVRLFPSSAWERLTDDQRRLIAALAAGRTVDVAASHLGWSRRTATRRLEEAKAALGVASTAEAVHAMPSAVING